MIELFVVTGQIWDARTRFDGPIPTSGHAGNIRGREDPEPMVTHERERFSLLFGAR